MAGGLVWDLLLSVLTDDASLKFEGCSKGLLGANWWGCCAEDVGRVRRTCGAIWVMTVRGQCGCR